MQTWMWVFSFFFFQQKKLGQKHIPRQIAQIICTAFWLAMLRWIHVCIWMHIVCDEMKSFILKMAKYLQLDILGHPTRLTLSLSLTHSHFVDYFSIIINAALFFTARLWAISFLCTSNLTILWYFFFSVSDSDSLHNLRTAYNFRKKNMLKSDRNYKRKPERQILFHTILSIN